MRKVPRTFTGPDSTPWPVGHPKYIPNPPFLVFLNTPYNAGPRIPLTCGQKKSQKAARLMSCISAEAGFNLGTRRLPAVPCLASRLLVHRWMKKEKV